MAKKIVVDFEVKGLDEASKSVESIVEDTKSLKQQFREAAKEAQTLAGAEIIDEAKLEAAIKKTAELKDRMNDVNEQVGVLTAGSKFETLSNNLGDIGGKIASLDFEGANESATRLLNFSKSITFADAAKGIKQLGSTFLQLGKALLTNPLFLIAAVIAGIVYAIFKLLEKIGVLKAITKALGKVFEWLMIPINAIIDGLKALTDWFGWTSNAAEDSAQKQADAAEKTAKAYEDKSERIIQGYDHEIKMAEINGESTRQAEIKKAYWILATAKARAKADLAAYQSAKLAGELEEEEIAELEKKYKASVNAARKAGTDITELKAGFRAEDKAAREKETEEEKKSAEDKLKAEADAAKKAAEQAKQYRADRLAAQREIKNLELENMEDGLEKEIAINQEKYRLLNEDTKNNEKLLASEKNAIIAQYTAQELTSTQELRNTAAEEKAAKEEEAAAKALEIKNREILAKAELDAKDLETKIAFLETQKMIELQNKELTESEKLLIEQNYKTQIDALRDEATQKEIDRIAKEKDEAFKAQQAKISIAQTYAGAVNSLAEGIFAVSNNLGKQDEKSKEDRAKKQFKVQKALNLGMAIIDGFKSITTSLAQSPIAIGPVPNPAGIASLAFAAVTTAVNIAKIASAQYKGGSSGGGGASAGGGGGAGAAANIPAPQLNAGTLFSTGGQSSQTIGGDKTKTVAAPVKAYVVEQEITSTQERMSNIKQQASI